MADQDAQDKNLPASAKKIQRSRAEGQVPRSRDLGHFAVILTGGALLAAGGPEGVAWLQQLMDVSLRFDAELLAKPGVMTERFLEIGLRGLLLSLGVGLCLSLVAVLSSLALGGWNFTMTAVAPKFSNLNPLTGIARLFQWQGLGQALKACALALVLALIAGLVMKNRIANYVGIMSVPLPAALAYAGDQLMGGLAFLGLGLALFAVIDVPLQYQLYMKRLKMSREEVKQEFKELEGNQEVKSRMRAKMREMAKRRMLAAVPTADLVVMNPTHYAVALKYEEGKMAAPQVVAKGADLLAMKIRDLAKDAKVPVLQSPMLARALYAHAELDREIPAALFAAVAQVLAYVYQLRAALAGRGVAPAMPDPVVPPELDPHNKPAAQRSGAPEDDEQ
ncbi:EscU/YscU/HrcU family type III secretion system export apparatus switch protein [Paucibacter sp. XJ19-41]|uniref:EscU/YscU/HrcU family type III secretion system export apparatus switch protein n=1 Tax=Paucibacter sp. XJ19-41 TaxID=2927824 RepID=UPI00234BF29F|nr:flagellar type III secretion system protein FlhB [Paucibacter sp. XJ19-41]MDC6170154.1 flagellar type III secretion system protein FlhB [Paucibacter sp. XJ19-41]